MTVTTIDRSHNDVRGAAQLSSYIAAIEREGEWFAIAAEDGGLDVPIVTCPGWQMRDLVRHLGEIHLWAAANVAYPKPAWLNVAELADLAVYWPQLAARWPSDTHLVDWYLATRTNLVEVLRSAEPDVGAFTFLPAPSPLMMWARRQASEIAVHRYDAEYARGTGTWFAPEFASDMLDELLTGFAPTYRDIPTSVPQVMQVDATDVGEQWWVTMTSSGMSTSRSGTEGDLVVAGTAANLYLTLWNRTAGADLDLSGDVDVLDLWRSSCRVVWSR